MATTRPQLRALREERGWTQQEVADQISRIAWLRRRERVGVNADMVAKWERGEKRPSPRYRDLLCLLFGADAQTLGIGVAAQLAGTRSEPEDGSLIATLGGAASLLDQMGAAGAILQPRMFGVWKDELMHRRAMLKLISVATAGDAAEQLSQAGYAVGFGRLQDFRRAVGRWSGSTPVRTLDDQLAALG